MRMPRALRWLVGGILVLLARPPVARAFAHLELGEAVEDFELSTHDGQKHRLAGKGALANVLVFFRPQQEHSLDALREMADCEKDFEKRPVHWLAVVSDSWDAEEVKAFVAQSGVKMPVVVDRGDALYGRLGVKLHPTIGVFDGRRRLLAYEPFREINYCDRIRARIRIALGELKEADFAKVENPERSVTRTEEGVARRHVNFARGLLRIQKYEKALAELDKAMEAFPSGAAWAVRGQVLAAMGRCPDALRAFDAAQKLEPANPDALAGRKACAR